MPGFGTGGNAIPHGEASQVADTDLFATALAIEQFCVDRGWEFCFIGGIAMGADASDPRCRSDINHRFRE